MLSIEDWNRLYDIEEKVNTISYTQDDVKFLINLIYKQNGNIIDPRTHNRIQEIIDSIEIPECLECDEETILNNLNQFLNIKKGCKKGKDNYDTKKTINNEYR